MSIKRLKKSTICLYHYQSLFKLLDILSNYLIKSGKDLIDFVMTIWMTKSDGKCRLKPKLIQWPKLILQVRKRPKNFLIEFYKLNIH